jgi:hypothetical protein
MAQASLVERHSGVVDLAVNNRPAVESYRFGAAVSLDAAYAGVTALFTVPRGHTFRSPTLLRNRVNLVGESNRGLTRASYDPRDYASTTVPGDTQISFVRVIEIDHAGTLLPAGPILVVPPPEFWVAGRQNLTLNGTAPNVPGLPNNLPPQTAMWVDFPRFAKDVTVFADGGSDIAVSFGEGRQEFIVPSTESYTFKETGATLMSLRGVGGTSAFRVVAALVNGLLA